MSAPAAPTVAVVDYGIGNLRSAEKALQRVGAAAELTSDPSLIGQADAVVLPGVGNFGRCVDALGEADLVEAVLQAADSNRPFLGICVGMQMLFESSQESPGKPGLGILNGHVGLLPDTVKRPQMQWNRVDAQTEHPIVGVIDQEWMYFVHSYAVMESPDALATCDYGTTVVAAAGRANVVATQFHPEKSGQAGLSFLSEFVAGIGQ